MDRNRAKPAVDWMLQTASRSAILKAQHPLPPGIEPGFWSLLLLQAGMQPGNLADMCLSKGTPWSQGSVLRDGVPGPARECFRNAGLLALEDASLTYVEGFACTAAVGIAMHHAWVVTADGKVLDPTWQEGSSYCGIGVRTDIFSRLLSSTGIWGIFCDQGMPSWFNESPESWQVAFPASSPPAPAEPQTSVSFSKHGLLRA